ncbi:MAG: magnesium transporter CorA family protein [Candidatus Komeilibacteria bacterium]
MITKLKQIHYQNITWIHCTKPSDSDLEYLQTKYGFHPLDMADVKNVSLRPKLDEYPKYLFMVLLFPFYDRPEREIKASEIDLFIGDDYLITVSDGNMKELDTFFHQCSNNEVIRQMYLADNTVALLHEIIHRLQNYTFPMLDHITLDIENIEQQMFAGQERRMVHEILIIKRNIVAFRRIMHSHKSIIGKLMRVQNDYFNPEAMRIYLKNALERSQDIWDILETHKETISAFDETNNAMISFQLNEIMKILTIISVILIPANLVASIFGMNATHTPIVQDKYGFWIILTIILGLILTLLIFFRKKRWL